MTKSILMSVQPKWLVKILNGEKTIEIRKTMPKCELPIDVYLYCTKSKPFLYEEWYGNEYKITYTKEWQERANEEDYTSYEKFAIGDPYESLNGLIIAKFTLNKVEEVVDYRSSYRINNDVAHTNEVARNSCLDFNDMKTYLKGKNGYAYHIDNLVIFDKPKELSEFMITNVKEGWTYYFKACEGFPPLPKETYIGLIDRGRAPIYCYKTLSKAPQSWQYAYKDKN